MSDDESRKLDQKRVSGIMEHFLYTMRRHYEEGEPSREKTFEVLNALGACVALTIQGADGPGGKAQEFFNKCVEQNLENFEKLNETNPDNRQG